MLTRRNLLKVAAAGGAKKGKKGDAAKSAETEQPKAKE